MAGKAGLKAGLIGTAVMLVWTVIGRFLPVSGAWVWVSSGVSLLMYAGIGVLAGFFLALPRTPGKGAGAGAIAGLISGVIAGVVGVVILNIQIASGGAVPGLSPEQKAWCALWALAPGWQPSAGPSSLPLSLTNMPKDHLASP
jgi:hypothetical protein